MRAPFAHAPTHSSRICIIWSPVGRLYVWGGAGSGSLVVAPDGGLRRDKSPGSPNWTWNWREMNVLKDHLHFAQGHTHTLVQHTYKARNNINLMNFNWPEKFGPAWIYSYAYNNNNNNNILYFWCMNSDQDTDGVVGQQSARVHVAKTQKRSVGVVFFSLSLYLRIKKWSNLCARSRGIIFVIYTGSGRRVNKYVLRHCGRCRKVAAAAPTP